MKLAIISHTEHYRTPDGRIAGWGATVREINHLADIFEEIYHVAFLYPGTAPPSALPYEKENIHFIPLVPAGGKTFASKLAIISQAPRNFRVIREVLRKVDVFQFRAPTGMGVYLLPWLTWAVRKPGWYKYAGNWMEPRPPWSFAWQRWWLTHRQPRPVTINGRWPEQPAHCRPFENPCLERAEREAGRRAMEQKQFDPPYHFCFVGRLEDAKGIHRILRACRQMAKDDRLGKVHLIGDGPRRSAYEAIAREIDADIIFHGFLPRQEVGKVLADCHFLLLPSDSEGFPKVLAEAANYGCLPVVSDVSCIGQYVDHGKNGWLIPFEALDEEGLQTAIREALNSPDLPARAWAAYQLAEFFTFEHYNQRIADLVSEVSA